MRQLLCLLVLGACLSAVTPAMGAPAPARPSSSVVELIADLGDIDPAVRHAAAQRLNQMSRVVVVAQAVALVMGKAQAAERDSRMFSTPAVALDLLVRMDPPRADALALEQITARDPDVRDTAAAIVARQEDATALPFLTRALREWGTDSPAGLRAVALGLDQGKRAETPQVRAAIIEVLKLQPLPTRNPKFTYANEHEPPDDGDLYRCWLFKADVCLGLIARHPFEESNDGVRRCLLIDELRVGGALALAQLKQPDTAQVVRSWLDRDQNTEHRLGLYRALFIVGGDEPADRLAARDMFTATQAPSAAWVEGLRAMVDLFSRHADEPALRVVGAWKLRGEATALRAAALDAMKAAHPDVYEKVLGKDYKPPQLKAQP